MPTDRRRSSSSAPASPARRPPRPCARRASTAASCCSAPSPSGPTSARRCPRTTCAARPSARAAYVHEEGFYAEHDIELRAGERGRRPRRGPPRARARRAASGSRYDRLLLATGAEPRRLRRPRRRARRRPPTCGRSPTATRCARASTRGGRLVVIGAGWIGSEVAASARQRGMDVTIIAPEAVPLERVLGPEVGAVYRDLHRDHGVDAAARRPAWRRSRATAASSASARSDGATIDCDAVVVGVGAAPRTELAEAAGLAVEQRRARRRAPGDERPGDLRRRRRRQPPPSRARAGCASSTGTTRCTRGRRRRARMLGADERLRRARPTSSPTSTTSAWSTPATRRAGTASSSAATRRRASSSPSGSPDGRVLAGMNVNVWDVTEPIQALIASGGQRGRRAAWRTRTSPLERPARRRPERRREPPAAASTMRACRSGSTRSRGSCSRAATFATLVARARRHRRDLEPDDLRQGDHGLGPLRRTAARARRGRRRRPQELFFALALDDVRAAARDAAGHLRAQRRTRRLHLVRVHAGPRRRRRGDDRPGARSLAAARPAQRDDQGARDRGRAVDAIEELTARGVNVNVTLLFSVERYEQVIEAYLRGLERRASAPASRWTGSPRWPRSSSRASTPRSTPSSPHGLALRGQVAIANAQRRLRTLSGQASPARAGRRSSAPARRRSGRCGRAPGPRTRATPTSSTSSELIAPRRDQHDARADPARVRRPRRGRRRRSDADSARGAGRPGAAAAAASTSTRSPPSSSARAWSPSATPTASCSAASKPSSAR